MKNKNRSPAARKELNEYIPQINILNSIQKNSNGITDSTSLKFAYKKMYLRETSTIQRRISIYQLFPTVSQYIQIV